MLHSFSQIQDIPCNLDTAWQFFSDPRNLQRITLPDMKFAVRSPLTDHIYAGQIIQYRVRPLFGIPVKWATLISHVTEKSSFVDEQIKGPFKFWHHQHFFTETNDGVRMVDVVHYELPLGFIGEFVHRFIVRERLKKIFDHRREVITRIFGEKEHSEHGDTQRTQRQHY